MPWRKIVSVILSLLLSAGGVWAIGVSHFAAIPPHSDGKGVFLITLIALIPPGILLSILLCGLWTFCGTGSAIDVAAALCPFVLIGFGGPNVQAFIQWMILAILYAVAGPLLLRATLPSHGPN